MVVVLAVLSAIVVPQLSGSAGDARLSALKSNLNLMRHTIDRYKLEHAHWPGNRQSSGASCPNGGSAGTGGVHSMQSLQDQLGFYTKINGRTCSTSDATFKFGPYLRDQHIPPNPLSGSNTVVISTAGELGLTSARIDGQGGWIYDTNTGQFIADDANFDDL